MVRSAGSLCSHWSSRLISQVSKSTGRTSTPISCSSRSAYSLTGIGIDSPPLPTLIPISQIEMELTKMRSASAMAADAAADRRSRCRVQKRRADVSSTTTMRQPIRRWSQRRRPRGIPTGPEMDRTAPPHAFSFQWAVFEVPVGFDRSRSDPHRWPLCHETRAACWP